RCHASDLSAGPAIRIGTGPAPLAGGAQQRVGAREQASRPALRPAWVHHPVTAAERMHLPGCKTPRAPILKTASKHICGLGEGTGYPVIATMLSGCRWGDHGRDVQWAGSSLGRWR